MHSEQQNKKLILKTIAIFKISTMVLLTAHSAEFREFSTRLEQTRPAVIYKKIDPTRPDPRVDPTRGHLRRKVINNDVILTNYILAHITTGERDKTVYS